MLKQGHEVAVLVVFKPKRVDSWMFHWPCLWLTPYQAEAMELPLEMVEVSGVKEGEVEEAAEALAKLKAEYGFEGLACGAIQSNYQKLRVERICGKLNLAFYAPLWGQPPESLLEETLKLRFDVVFTAVAALGLDERWLGRRLDMEAVEELKELSRRFGINLALEGGEAETFVREACFYRRRVELEDLEKVWRGDWGYLKVGRVRLTRKLYSD